MGFITDAPSQNNSDPWNLHLSSCSLFFRVAVAFLCCSNRQQYNGNHFEKQSPIRQWQCGRMASPHKQLLTHNFESLRARARLRLLRVAGALCEIHKFIPKHFSHVSCRWCELCAPCHGWVWHNVHLHMTQYLWCHKLTEEHLRAIFCPKQKWDRKRERTRGKWDNF